MNPDDEENLVRKDGVSPDSNAPRNPERRRILTMGLVSVASGLLGFDAGSHLSFSPESRMRGGLRNPAGIKTFLARAKGIWKRHDEQTQDDVARLKAKYEKPVFGKVRMWELIEKLAICIDPTDAGLYCTSQFLHVQQLLAAMEKDGIQDRDLLLAGLLHDLGKVAMLSGELQENVVCQARPVGEFDKGIGLDRVVYQFGHWEIVYLRLKDHLPDHLAWLVRYHNISVPNSSQYMNNQDRKYAEKYLATFQNYDSNFKSYSNLPEIDLNKYRALIEDTFPHPISF